MKIKLEIRTLDKDEDIKVKEKNPFEWFDLFENNFKSLYGHLSTTDKIIQSYTFGYAVNVGIKFDTHRKYNIINSISETKEIQPLFPGSNNYETFLTTINPTILYLKLTRYNTMSIITNVDTKSLIEAHPLYFNKLKFKNIHTVKDKETKRKKIYEFHGPFLEIFLDQIRKNSGLKKVIFQEYTEYVADNDENMRKYIDLIRKRLI